MKKMFVFVVVFSFLFLFSAAWAQETTVRTEMKIVELNGTTWEISVKAADKRRARAGGGEKDILTFSNNRFTSQNLEAQGYSATGCSVRLGNDGSTIWETMQTKEGEGRVFWRGSIDPETMQMRGVLRKLSEKGKTKDLSFTSTGVTR